MKKEKTVTGMQDRTAIFLTLLNARLNPKEIICNR